MIPVTIQNHWNHIYNRWCVWLNKLEENNFNLCFSGPTPFRVWSYQNSFSPNKELSLELGKYYQKHLLFKSIRHHKKEIEKRLVRLRKSEESFLESQRLLLESAFKQF